MTWLETADELLSWMNAVSVDAMSPGIATMRLPPSLGVPAACARRRGRRGRGWGPALAGAWLAGAGVVVDPLQAANRIAARARRCS